MTTGRTVSPFEPTGRRRELARLIGQIQTLTRARQCPAAWAGEGRGRRQGTHTRAAPSAARGPRATHGNRRARQRRLTGAAIRSFTVRLDPTRRDCRSTAPLKRCSSSSRGSLTVVWRDTTRVSTELGDGDTASTNPSGVEVLLAGAEGATLLALVSRGEVLQIGVASCNSVRVRYELCQTTHTATKGERVMKQVQVRKPTKKTTVVELDLRTPSGQELPY
jgi:hypothetical protein